MTLDERIEEAVGAIARRVSRLELDAIIRESITAAVEEERDASIEIAKRVGQSQGAFLGDWPTAELIVKLIRARSTASRSAEPAEK